VSIAVNTLRRGGRLGCCQTASSCIACRKRAMFPYHVGQWYSCTRDRGGR
jgi:hypothetical protein